MAETSETFSEPVTAVKEGASTPAINGGAVPFERVVGLAREQIVLPSTFILASEHASSDASKAEIAPGAEVASATLQDSASAPSREAKAPVIRPVRRAARKKVETPRVEKSVTAAGSAKRRANSRMKSASPGGATHSVSAEILDGRPLVPAKARDVEAQHKLNGIHEKSLLSLVHIVGFGKGNVSALAESGTILGRGLNELANGSVADGHALLEAVKADARDLAAIRSPAALFRFQADIACRSLRTALELGSKNLGAILKVTSETAAPVAERLVIGASSLRRPA